MSAVAMAGTERPLATVGVKLKKQRVEVKMTGSSTELQIHNKEIPFPPM